ncbi:MAG TPA: 6-carboxytetrahydropterin synthase [Polyangiaceae bacterium]|jgi:6-pyruvoyl-tetrahydropterin synthase|nr:6-carboxytetrahydropterin synthase [Polyangiaceae bacterium]
MFSVAVREHMMIAHSFKGELFGPAQKLHGATYVVDVEFRRKSLDPNNVVVDIGRAGTALKAIVDEFNFRNLDEVASLEGQNTTTEFMCMTIFSRMSTRIKTGELGPGSEGLDSLKVTLHESHVAWASFEGPVA